jgi:Zn-dependent alcohol dehydrogenase
MKTKAAVAWKAGAPLSIETVELDGPKAGEVLVEIKATGICHTDHFTLSGADPERRNAGNASSACRAKPICASSSAARRAAA